MNVIGVDIGGTFIKYGVLNEKGEILFKDKSPTPGENCKKTIPELIARKVSELKAKYNPAGIGISTAGLVDSAKGTVVFALNFKDYSGCEMKKILEAETGLPTSVENDANCAAIGEMWTGAGKNSRYIVFLTLGTGVGGAIIINGKLYKGFRGYAGEFCKVLASGKEIRSKDVSSLWMDNSASTRSLTERYKKITGRDINGIELAGKVRAGDKDALSAYNDFLECLNSGLETVTWLFDPEVIVIGGGISAQGDFFFNKVNEMLKNTVPEGQKDVKVKKAELENDAGTMGAGYICLHKDYIL